LQAGATFHLGILGINMKLSNAGFELIKQFEGLKLTAYLCPANVWTIGYGHTAGVKEGDVINKFEADMFLITDVRQFEEAVNRAVKVRLEQNEFDALVCFAFNVGAKAFRDSTLLKVLNEGRKNDVPAQLMRWTRGGGKVLKGLERRRRAEAALWRGIDDKAVFEVDTREKPDKPLPRKPITQSKTAIASLIGTASGTAAVVNEVADTARNAVDSFSVITASLPWFALGGLILAAGAFVIWDRYQKAKEGV
jgi:lysozyme